MVSPYSSSWFWKSSSLDVHHRLATKKCQLHMHIFVYIHVYINTYIHIYGFPLNRCQYEISHPIYKQVLEHARVFWYPHSEESWSSVNHPSTTVFSTEDFLHHNFSTRFWNLACCRSHKYRCVFMSYMSDIRACFHTHWHVHAGQSLKTWPRSSIALHNFNSVNANVYYLISHSIVLDVAHIHTYICQQPPYRIRTTPAIWQVGAVGDTGLRRKSIICVPLRRLGAYLFCWPDILSAIWPTD